MSTATANHFPDQETARVAANFGMWVFLATELLFFAPLLLGYTYCRVAFPQGFAAASRHTEVIIGTLNTAILLTSSFTMAMAVELHTTLSPRIYRLLLGLTALFGVAFLVLKGFEYHTEWEEHLIPGRHFQFEHNYARTAQLFFFLYFVLTGIHAVHLSIGIIWVLLLACRKSKLKNDNLLSNAGLYWHFVDIVWIFLYPLIYLVARHG